MSSCRACFPDGKVRATDVYILASGEFFSAALRRAMLPSIAKRGRNRVDTLSKHEQDYIRDVSRIAWILDLMNRGKMKQALAQFGELRAETRKDKTVLMMRLRARNRLTKRNMPRCSTNSGGSIPRTRAPICSRSTYYSLKKDFDRALASVDRLDESLSGDGPYSNKDQPRSVKSG